MIRAEIARCRRVLDAINTIEALELTESERARIHALTRKVTMTDDDLWPIGDAAFETETPRSFHDILMDLRDRYEERGKYAPAALEVVKQ